MNKLIHEPLVHFLIIGAALFLIYANINETVEEDKDQIHVTKENIKKLSQKWVDVKGKEPNAKEKKELLDNFIQEEVLYREALKKGLDKDDDTIHLHLAKKMKFVLDDLSPIKKPTDTELKKYFQENKENFKKEASISFNQVVFTYDKDKEKMKKSALIFLEKLHSKKSPKVAFVGDKVELTQNKTIKNFGEKFSNELFKMQTAQWDGPFDSKYGLHLIYVHSRQKSKIPEFSTVKYKVEAALLKEKQEMANKKFYEKLQKNYEVIVD